MLQLILGEFARSGKSRLAEQTAISMQLAVTCNGYGAERLIQKC